MKKEKKDFLTNLFPGVILSMAAAFLICIYAPLDMYSGNKGEFWFDIYDLFPIIALMFVIVALGSILIFSIALLIHKICYRICFIVYFVAYVATYVQGNFLVSNLPPLDGTNIDWTEYGSQRISTIVVWLVLILAVLLCICFLKYDILQKVAVVVSSFISGMLFITLISVLVMNHAFEDKLDLYVSAKQEYEYSSEKNFIILVLDATNASTLVDMMEEYPEYKEIFSDFTFYENTMSGYPFTMHSIPMIFSGDWYENDEPYETYLANSYKESALLSTLEEKDYHMGVYEEEYVPLNEDSETRFENIITPKESSVDFWQFVKKEFQLVGFRYAPFSIKKYCVVMGADFNQVRGTEYEYPLFSANNYQFYYNLNTMPISLVEDKWFKFIHIEGAHVPFRYDKDMNVIENGSYKDNMQATMTITATYLNKLKENDIYDNSVIIIMADHGYNEEDAYGRQNPILFVKGIEETHDDMLVSQAPISQVDFSDAYIRLANDMPGTDVFDYKDNDIRQRRYLFYFYLEENHMEEYITNSHAADTEAMELSGETYDWDNE